LWRYQSQNINTVWRKTIAEVPEDKMLLSVDALLDSLRNARRPEEFSAVLTKITIEIGFDFFAYANIGACIHGRDGEPATYLSNMPAAWMSRYIGERYYEVDPVLQTALRVSLPFQWDDTFARETWTPAQETMMSEAREHGICQGLLVPIHGPGGPALLSLVSGEPDRQLFSRLVETHRYVALIVALHVHEAIRTSLFREAANSAPRLSRREVECLRWAAAGKTSWEIGTILGIAERTVNAHLGSVMRKLQVHSRAHAIALAFQTGVNQRRRHLFRKSVEAEFSW
jgi:LuxR family transcriptional activator of conjugal transfer of Ti plasmids